MYFLIKYLHCEKIKVIFAAYNIPGMDIIAREDPDQRTIHDRKKLALCPYCGQKLAEIESIFNAGVFRLKCRRCKKYIRVAAISKEG